MRELALALAHQTAEQFLVSAALLSEDLAPPEDRHQRGLWEQRQRARRAEMRLASLDLLRYLQLAREAERAREQGTSDDHDR